MTDELSELYAACSSAERRSRERLRRHSFTICPSLEEPHRCRGLYCGYMKQHDFVTNYLLENQRNDIEHVFLCFNCPLDYSGQEQGLLSGISSRTMLPVSAKCILSDQPLAEDENLISSLLLTKEDLRLTRKYNMFMLE